MKKFSTAVNLFAFHVAKLQQDMFRRCCYRMNSTAKFRAFSKLLNVNLPSCSTLLCTLPSQYIRLEAAEAFGSSPKTVATMQENVTDQAAPCIGGYYFPCPPTLHNNLFIGKIKVRELYIRQRKCAALCYLRRTASPKRQSNLPALLRQLRRLITFNSTSLHLQLRGFVLLHNNEQITHLQAAVSVPSTSTNI